MSTRRSTAVVTLALLGAAAVTLSGCGSSTGSSGGGGNSGPINADPNALALSTPYVRPKVPDAGPITVAVDQATTNYNNNIGATNAVSNIYVLNLLEPSPFFVNDEKNVSKVQIDGDLMTSVKVLSTSPQVIEYNISPKAVWSDGQPVDCSDFYLQWLSGAVDNGDVAAAFNNAQPGYDHIGSIDCSNNNKTVTAHFSKAWADWQGLFSNMLPAHVLEQATGVPDITKLNDTNAADHDNLIKIANFYTGGANNNTGFGGLSLQYDLSAGPYTLKSFDGQSDTVLVRNPKWWGNPAGPSQLDIRVNSDDESAYQQLQNKEIQIMGGGQPDGAVAQQVAGSGGQFQLHTGTGVTFEHLDYNVQNAVFKQYPELRKALSLCVNRQDVINKVVADVDPNTKPLGEVLFLPTEAAYTDHYANVGHGDEAAAKQVLQQAGWTMGSDGYLQKNGKDAEITIGHKPVPRRSQTVQAIQAECHQAGIKIDDFESPGFNSGDLQHGNFQVALFAWTGSPFKSGFTPIYQSVNGGLGASNYQHYSDPKVDQLLSQADGELDWSKRITDLQQADQLIAQDDYTLPLFALPEFEITDGSIVATNQQDKQVPLQDNEASSGALWDANTWQKASK